MIKIKDYIPQVIRRKLGVMRTVIRRMIIWHNVARQICGESAEDQAVLKRAIRRSFVTVWRNLDDWQFPMVDEDCYVISKGVGKFHIRAHTDDLFHVLPRQEPAVEEVIRETLRSGDVFVDAGANIGYYSILASNLVGSEGQVIACEMIPETLEKLRYHVDINKADNVTVIEGALADIEGQTLQAYVPDGKFGQASIARYVSGRNTAVKTKVLEKILGEVKLVHMMKMDLEGAELGALKGLGAATSKVQRVVFENQDDPKVFYFLDSLGFVVKRVDGRNALASRLVVGD